MQIPHNFEPRDYQLPLLDAMDRGFKRAVCIWHRRAGKDKTLVNLIAKKAFEKKGIYYYFFPTYSQAKKIIWDGIDGDGFKFLDHFPEAIVKQKHQNELKIELTNGSIFQLVGTDKYDSIRGTNPIGCIFSEYAFQNPMAWEVVRPILAQNGGWAAFNTTPNGKNHSYDLYEMARDNPDWFCQRLTVDDTKCVSDEIIKEERLTGMSEEMIQQEYYCSFDIGALGSYYSEQMVQAREEDRITTLPFNRDIPIEVWFDLGIDDMMAMWFIQKEGEFINCISYYENNNKAIPFYMAYIDDFIDSKKGKLSKIVLPHDSIKRELTTGQTPQQLFTANYGSHRVRVVEIGAVDDGIRKTRSTLNKCRFDKDTCRQGLRCLENYHRQWDEVRKVFKQKPEHDWSSHGSDAFRTGCMSLKDKKPSSMRVKQANPFAAMERACSY